MENKYTHRYIARIVLEAETPLFVGSGESSLMKDALVQRDMHGLPMIQATSLAGVLRHSLEDSETDKNKWNSFFGYQVPKRKKGLGSQVKISSAYLIIENNKIAENIELTEKQHELKKYFDDLPVRQHVRITDKGVADTKNNGLFDNEVVYKGSRFLFEIELKGNAEDEKLWDEFLKQLANPLFRIGQGTRNGYGKLSVNSCKSREFELNNDDFNQYLEFNPSLNAENEALRKVELKEENNLTHYKLELKPESFFVFSAGYGDDEVDNMPVREKVVSYDTTGTVKEPKEQTLIPASSIKGALRHRTAFHFNKQKEKYVDNITDKKYLDFLSSNNDAVYELFGAEEGHEKRKGKRGKIIMNDILIPDEEGIKNDKIFNHVAIDRFTGGAMDGALFSEKVSYFEDENKEVCIDIWLEKTEFSEKVINAFEETLKDVCKGLLPLGGMTTKGHGIFTGKLLKDSKEEFNYEN